MEKDDFDRIVKHAQKVATVGRVMDEADVKGESWTVLGIHLVITGEGVGLKIGINAGMDAVMEKAFGKSTWTAWVREVTAAIARDEVLQACGRELDRLIQEKMEKEDRAGDA